MSDQPTPTTGKQQWDKLVSERRWESEPKPTTGEWTADDVKRMATLRGDASQNVADAHNAALAEREQEVRNWLNKFCFESLDVATEELDERQQTINDLRSRVHTLVDALNNASQRLGSCKHWPELLEVKEAVGNALAKVKEGKE